MDIKKDPFPVKRALKKFGQDLRDARKGVELPWKLLQKEQQLVARQ